jgi:hypothetical protein
MVFFEAAYEVPLLMGLLEILCACFFIRRALCPEIEKEKPFLCPHVHSLERNTMVQRNCRQFPLSFGLF